LVTKTVVKLFELHSSLRQFSLICILRLFVDVFVTLI